MTAGSSRRALAAGLLTAAVGAVGVALGVVAAVRGLGPVQADWLLPLSGVRLHADATSGLFMVVVGAVGVCAGIYTIGYGAHVRLSRTTAALLPVFVAAMLAVPAADSVATFLVCWELMAVVSLGLVLADHRSAAAREAGMSYAVLTQLGFLAIVVGLFVLSAAAHTESFVGLGTHAHAVRAGTRNAEFVLTLIGFGSKAGLVPLHAWLPRAHSEAPGPVSALMSAAMVSLGVYGLVRVDLDMLGGGPRWWGVVMLLAGAVSAVYGVLQASVATDLKRLLAYSTTENMGLVAMGLGAAMLLHASGSGVIAVAATTAALLHVVNHAAFKTLSFLGAGAVTVATGVRDLDRMGGLARRMPATAGLFSIGALGASGLPLGCGFVSEWLLLQSLIHGVHGGETMLGLVAPIGVGVIALTAGIGVAAMLKAFGVGFLARPRSPGATEAREVGPAMVAGMSLAAVGCVTLALGPVVVVPLLRRVVDAMPAGRGVPQPSLGVLVHLPGIAGSTGPITVAIACAVGIALMASVRRLSGRRRPAPVVRPLWVCGGTAPSAAMQYTATSFAQPLQRVFEDVLAAEVDVEVTHVAESRYLLERVTYRSRLVDAVESRLYRPVVGAVVALSGWVRRAHTGSVHLYLAYGALAVVVALLVAT